VSEAAKEVVLTYPAEPNPWVVEANTVFKYVVDTRPATFGLDRNPEVWKLTVVDRM
jgi:hypothetical protein